LKKWITCGRLETEGSRCAFVGSPGAFPRRIEDDKWLVWGATSAGRQLQVVFVLDEDGTVFVIHARDLTAREKRRLRRR
jgi:uncharacterized DUF497 family protein